MPGVGFNLSQSLKQQQTLAPQMRQGLKMLQMTSLELRAELQHEMEVNPVIEDVTSRIERQMSSELPEAHSYGEVTEKPLEFGTGENMASAMGTDTTDDGYRDYFLGNMESASGDEEAQSRRDHLFDSMVKTETLQQHLMAQIGLSDIPQEDRDLAGILVENVDDDGYFRGSIPDIMMVTKADMPKIESVLAQIRAFDPLGCGARNLRECWLAQMEKLDDSPWEDEIRSVLENHFDDLVARRVPTLCAALHITTEEYPRMLKVKPGEYVKPEVFAYQDKDGEWLVRVDGRDLPEIHISQRYQKMLADPSVTAEVKSYIRERIRAAEVLRESVKKRQQTIHDIAQAIVDAQPDFFKRGMGALKPLTMQQVAEQVGVVGTTVSRTVRDKYMSTPFGVIELRKFFTSGGAKTEDGETMSNASVKERIKAIIDAENTTNPYSDDQITEILKAEGVNISRRTVAKYRMAMKIPGKADRAAFH